jgi:hypothetical protein
LLKLKRILNTLDDFIKNVHKLGYTIVEYNDIKIPVLYIEDTVFEQILKISYDKRMSIDTNLNIYDDGQHVFVDIILKFFNTDLEETYLLYANETLDFFSNLANAGMIGLVPSNDSQSNIFFIQLPKKDKAEKALEMIKEKLKKS